MSDVRAWRAALVHCLDDPGRAGPDAVVHHADGLLLVEDGHIAVPDRPGLGFTFDPDAIERYRVR